MSSERVLLVEEGGVGGVAEYTAELASALARMGWGVEVATARDPVTLATGQVRIHPVFPYVRGRSAMGRLIRRAGLSKVVNGITHLAANAAILPIARRCAVVHVQGGEWPPLGALQALMVRAVHRPLVWTPHNTFDRSRRAYGRSRTLTERCAARIIVHAERDRDTLPPTVRDRAVVIPHGEYGRQARRGRSSLDPEEVRAALGAGDEEVVVLLFGQLRVDKGVRDLLEAAVAVEGVRVVLAGEDKGALREVDDLRADPRLRARLTVVEGFIAPGQAGELFAAADVVALPYHRASASGVLLLASGYERPVVAYPVGGLPEYIEGDTGWICRTAEPAALAQALRAIVAAGREVCRQRGAAARRLAQEQFSWDAIAQRTASLYREVLAETSAQKR